ncbi:MAG TPA: polysaccharide biosynthesis tyrosine autokinase [Acetobacteraceae bacterium]|nr:polysaccharide biosynthesis tyrosine autokinase [Acetobacteraceae bacterium]
MEAAVYGMEEAQQEQSFLGELAGKLWRRKGLIAGSGLALFAVLAIAIQFLPKQYGATAAVSVEPPPRAVSTGNVVQDVPFDSETIGTEMALLQSQQLLTETILKTGLLKNSEFDPDLKPTWLARLTGWLPSDAPPNATMAQRQLADTLRTLREHLVFQPVPRSRVIEITAAAKDNGLAANIANTIANLYIGGHLNYRQDMTTQAHSFVEHRIQELKAAAVAASNAAVNFQVSHGLTDTSGTENSTIIQEQASSVNTELAQARNQLTTLTAAYDSDRRANPETLAAVLSSSTIARLREQQSTAMAERARFASTYGPHSQVLIPLNRRVAAIGAEIRDEAEREVQAIPSQIASAQQTVTTLSQRLDMLQSQMAGLDKARAELALLRVESAARDNIYQEFLQRATQTADSVLFPAAPVRIVSLATASMQPSFPDNAVMLPAAGVVAAFLACCLGLLVERGRGMASTTEVETMLGIPALGMLPLRTGKTEQMYQDGIEDLLNRLLYDERANSVLVTSTLPGEGKTMTARSLIHAAADRGLNALLIEADLRSTSASRLRSAATLGLGEVLRGEVAASDATHHPEEGFSVLPAGQSRGNPSRLLSNPRMQQAVAALKDRYDFIAVDAPPALVGGDVWSLSRYVDRTILLAHWERTEPQHVALAIRQLVKGRGGRSGASAVAGTNVAGLVLNMVDPSRCMKLGNADSVRFSSAMFKYYRQ